MKKQRCKLLVFRLSDWKLLRCMEFETMKACKAELAVQQATYPEYSYAIVRY